MDISQVGPEVIGQRVLALRTELGFSLQRLADVSGVSRSMISAVERGGRVPTVVTLDRLAGALGTTSARLLLPDAHSSITVLRRDEQPELQESGWRRRVVNPVLPGVEFEFMRVEIDAYTDAGGFDPHTPGSREYVAVESGTLTLELDAVTHVLQAGDSIYFSGDTVHAFRNDHAERCTYYLVMDMGSHDTPKDDQ